MNEHLLFHVVADRYIRYILKPRENNQAREIDYMEQWKGYFSGKLVTEIKKSDVAQAKDELFLHKQGNSKGTGKVAVNRAMARLRHFFSTCEDEWDLIPSNPCRGIKAFKESKGKLEYLLVSQLYKLLDECEKSRNKDMYLFALMAVSTGGRKSEINNLKFENINYESKSAVLPKQKNGNHGELYLNDDILNILKSKRRTTGRIFAHKYMDKGFKMAAARAGVPDTSPHILRHTFASHFAMNGASTLDVQTALRVSSPTLVARYSHLTQQHIHDKISKMTTMWNKENRHD